MATKKTETELLDQRIVILMRGADVEIIDEWMFSRRMKSRGEAIRMLLAIGMNQVEKSRERADRKNIKIRAAREKRQP